MSFCILSHKLQKNHDSAVPSSYLSFIAFRCVFFFIRGNMKRITLRSLHQTIIVSLSAHSAVHLAVRRVGITSVLRLLAQYADFCFSTQFFQEKKNLSLSFQQKNATCACGKPQNKNGEGLIFCNVRFAFVEYRILWSQCNKCRNLSDYIDH